MIKFRKLEKWPEWAGQGRGPRKRASKYQEYYDQVKLLAVDGPGVLFIMPNRRDSDNVRSTIQGKDFAENVNCGLDERFQTSAKPVNGIKDGEYELVIRKLKRD